MYPHVNASLNTKSSSNIAGGHVVLNAHKPHISMPGHLREILRHRYVRYLVSCNRITFLSPVAAAQSATRNTSEMVNEN